MDTQNNEKRTARKEVGKRRIRLNHTLVGGREKLDGKKLKKQKQGLSK